MLFYYLIPLLIAGLLLFVSGYGFCLKRAHWKRQPVWAVKIAEGDRAPIRIYGPFWNCGEAVRWELAFNDAIARRHPESLLEAHVVPLGPGIIPEDPAARADGFAEAIAIARERPIPRHPPQLYAVEEERRSP